MIPRRLFQTHKSAAHLEPLHQKCARTLKTLNQDFEYRFFSDRDCRRLIEERNAGFLPLWDYYRRPVQKADFFRVFAVYELGGFYFDLDVFFHEPLDNAALDAALVFPLEWTMSPSYFEHRHRHPASSPKDLAQIGNYAFGGEAGHWFFREVLEEMIRRTGEIDAQNVNDDDVLYSTGPDVLNAVFRRFRGRLANERIVVLEGDQKPRPPCHTDPQRAGSSFQFGKFGNHLMTSVWRGGM
jgi:mannosyltransferase OCH1-like enzyme